MDSGGYINNENENTRGQFSNQYPYPEVMNDIVQNTPQPHAGKPSNGGGFFAGLVTGILLCLLIVTGCFTIVTIVKLRGKPEPVSINLQESVINTGSTAKIKKIEDIIRKHYYKDEDIDIERMEDGIYAGLMDSLGDPYSVYYNKEELKEIMNSSKGVYYGIGAYMSYDETTGCAVISGTIPNTPAEEAGLRYGDLLYKVDGETVQGMSLDEVVSRVRGEGGTKVHLTMYREGETDYLEIDIVRRKVESPTVTYEMLDDGIGYIRITEFDDVTTDQFTDAYATIKGNSPKGLIIDLRGNPGGNVDTVVNISSQILPKGIIFYTEDKDGKTEEYTCNGEHEIQIPLVVLVDSYSASASEILAGAVKDYGIGKLVGTTTFGKGIVQRIISLSDGTAVKLTESAYYTPSGKNIHGIGIEPDVEIKFDSAAYYDDKVDNQLEKGKEVLREMME